MRMIVLSRAVSQLDVKRGRVLFCDRGVGRGGDNVGVVSVVRADGYTLCYGREVISGDSAESSPGVEN